MRTLLAVVALATAGPVAAQEVPAALDYRSMSDAALAEQLAIAASELLSEPCKHVPLFGEFARRNPGSDRASAGPLIAQAFCASKLGRDDEGLGLLKQAEDLVPDLGLDLIGLFFAISIEDGAEAAMRLRRLAQTGELAAVEPNQIYASLKVVREDGLEDDELALELTGSDAFAEMDPFAQSGLAKAAIGHSARTGAMSRVDALLPYVREPYTVLDLLALRKYEAVWPAIEEYAGENLSKVTANFAAWTSTRLAAEPEEPDRLRDYSYALLFAGRFGEAVALASDWLGWPDSGRTLEEGDAWALNTQVYALDALGRIEEADRIFDQLAALPADENPWVVNFVINRQSRLTNHGRWEDSLAAGELARSVADVYGSPYARMLVAFYHACAFHKLGRPEESERELDFIREHFAAAPSHAVSAYLCTERPDEATDIVLRIMRDDAVRDTFLIELQDDRFTYFWTPSVLPSARDLVFGRDDLRAEALEHVRILPERFVPIAYLRRQRARSPP